MNRHKPVYKIKGYRLNTEPVSVTLEGSTLVDGTDYNLDFKPVSSAYWAQDISFHAPLQSTTADIGYNLTGSTNCAFVPAKYGYGMECNNDEWSEFDNFGNNVDYARGAIEFWLKPASNSTDNTERTYFRSISLPDYFRFIKDSSNNLLFDIHDGTNTFTETVTSANYSWSAGDWVHIRLEWNDADPSPYTNQQKIFINGIESTHTDSSGDYNSSLLPTIQAFYVGNPGQGDPEDCNCIFDEFYAFDFNGSGAGGGTGSLTSLAEGGDTADSDEYLFDATNDYTFSFAEKDDYERGEYLYFGSDAQVSGVNVDLATLGVGSNLDLNWDYWNGTSWANLEAISGFTDGTTNLTADGAVYWSAIPTNWQPYSVNESPDLYYIRASLDYDFSLTRSYSTSPIEDTIKTDILILQYLSNISSNDQTLIVVPEYLLPGAFILIIFKIYRRKNILSYRNVSIKIT